MAVDTKNLDDILRILSLLLEWNGTDDNTPDDTVILSVDVEDLTVDDVRTAITTITSIKNGG